jgi:hypothetical protein
MSCLESEFSFLLVAQRWLCRNAPWVTVTRKSDLELEPDASASNLVDVGHWRRRDDLHTQGS